MKNNSVSILVPIYCVEKYIERCVRSLFEQTYDKIEYVFVDDCSPDRSVDILKRVINNYPQRATHVRIISHDKNLGLAATRNTAVENCHTEFLMHVDSDDYIDRNVISECIALIHKTDADIVTIGVKRVRNTHTKIDKIDWSPDSIEMTRRTTLYKDNNIKVEVGRGMAEDLQVVPKLFYCARQTIYTGNVFYNYVFNDCSYTASFSLDKFRQSLMAINVLQTFFQDKESLLQNAVEKRKAKIIANALLNCAKTENNDFAYREIKTAVSDETMKNKELMTLHEKVALNLNSFILLRLYVLCGTVAKGIISKLKL